MCAVKEMCVGDVCFTSYKELSEERGNVNVRKMLFNDRWVDLKKIFVSGISQKKADIPCIPSLLLLFVRSLLLTV